MIRQSGAPSLASRGRKWRPRLAALALLTVSSAAGAIVIRHDVSDALYRISASEFPALVDMPGEGHGVLITPRWVVTAAHAVTWQSALTHVTINERPRRVERLVVHPGYQRPPQELATHALTTWDWTLFRAQLAASDDIALVHLAEPVTDVAPIPIRRNADELGQTVMVIGRGATGTGETGYEFASSHRTALRRAYNRVTSAHGRWFCYMFDRPAGALPLEGAAGSGDSGGPVLIRTESTWLLAGLTSWVDPQSGVRTPGRYGQISCNVRLSHYAGWIDSVTSAPTSAGRTPR
jgi:hypothetical protein